jgi:uroporphyrinogen decarboxylase
LAAGGPRLETRVNWLLETLGPGPFIFNLGHGILPDTPIENVETLVALVKGEAA